MQRPTVIPVWKEAPFLRMLLPLIAGILLQWYYQLNLVVIVTALACFSVASALFVLFPLAFRFRVTMLQGYILQLLFVAAGSLITWQKDIRHSKNWYGNHYEFGSFLVVRLNEPPIKKNKTFKADGYVEAVIKNGKAIPGKGKLLLYFSKDSFDNKLQYGDRIIVRKHLQAIRNSGNPGGFNYQRYAAFQGLFHNVFLKTKDWHKLPGNSGTAFNRFVFSARDYVISVLQRTVTSGKDELGITQALLIGYTNDLDKDLVQAYSNTGVVHIIAISGMHLGLIYVLLLWIIKRIPVINRSRFGQLVLILVCLWMFAILTGASPSVLRAAVMFTCISIGKNLKKQVSIYTALAASAFLMLCVNPYYLWAVGFQLSYLAVLGIVIFQKPIYNLLYIKNKFADKVWQLVAVSTAAQLLTFPVCIYYFHQFPNLFILSNIVAVPLATVILYGSVLLAAVGGIPIAGIYVGKLVGWLTWLMNSFIRWVDDLSFAVWDRLPATVFSTWLLYAAVLAFSAWLMQKNKRYFKIGLIATLLFFALSTFGKWQTYTQQKLVVYNVPQKQAIDLIDGNDFQFLGDSLLLEDGLLQNFHLKPGRIAQQLNHRVDALGNVFRKGNFILFKNKRILLLDQGLQFHSGPQKIRLDLLIISNNQKTNMARLAAVFEIGQCVADASNPAWKIEKWKADCRLLGIKFHDVPSKGAFIYNIGI